MALSAAIVMLSVGCAIDDADSSEAMMSAEVSLSGSGFYEGEWTVNRQVVDTARLVVNGSVIQVRLPEDYLFNAYFALLYDALFTGASDAGDKGESPDSKPLEYELLHVPATVQVLAQGYSEQSQYLSFSSGTMQGGGSLLRFNTCSFEATFDGTPFRISVLSKENATAVLQNATGQWTLGIPVDGFQVKNLKTGETVVHEVSGSTIYYNTKRRIG